MSPHSLTTRRGRGGVSPVTLFSFLVPALFVAVFGAAVLAVAALRRTDAWLLGDWLIDYSAGFSRRGLVGEAIRQAAGVVPIDRLVLTSLIQGVVFVSLLALVTVLFIRHEKGLTSLLLFVSPAFAFYFVNFFGTMRKEILLLLLVVGVLFFSRTQRGARVGLWVLGGVFPLLVLAHEGMAFYLGFVLVIVFLLVSDGRVSGRQGIVAAVAMSGATAVLAFVTYRWGTSPGIDEQICANLVDEGFSRRICRGAISFLDRDTSQAIDRVFTQVTQGNYVAVYLLVLALAAVPFVFVRWSKALTVFFALSLLATLPLFVVAIDWGRWIVISVWLLTLITVRFDGTKHVRVTAFGPETFPALFFAALAVILYATLWSVPHCCEPRVGLGVIDRVLELLRFIGLR